MAKRVRVVYDVETADIQAALRRIDALEASTERLRKETRQYGNEASKSAKKAQTGLLSIKDAIGLISFAAIVEGLRRVGGEVLRVIGEFQRMEAVLTNSLGSNSAARDALTAIQVFAARTPYSVIQLSNAFVKLTNQGLQPSILELQNYGDLAASVGKELDQLAEAVIDATVGEFERLKEFGIKAKQEGDRVAFTFRGVTTEVDKTSEAINDYILSLGELEGVSGSTDAISKTLNGTISNLGDSWEALLNVFGQQNSGIIIDTIRNVAGTFEVLRRALLDLDQIAAEQGNDIFMRNLEAFKELEYGAKEYANELSLLETEYTRQAAAAEELQDKMDGLRETINQGAAGDDAAGQFGVAQARKQLAELEDQYLSAQRTAEGTRLTMEFLRRELGLTGDETDEAKKAQDEYNKALEAFNERMEQKLNDRQRLYQQTLADIEAQDKLIKILQDGSTETVDLGAILDDQEVNSFFDKFTEGWGFFNEELDMAMADAAKTTQDFYEQELEREQEYADRSVEIENERIEKRRQKEEEYQEWVRRVRMETANALIDIAQTLLREQQERDRAALDSLQNQKEQELELVGNNQEARQRVEEEYAKKKEQLDAERIAQNKEARRRNILVDTAANVVRSVLNGGGIPWGLPFGALAAAMGAAQAAAVGRYKDGVIDLKGPGTGTSDSIPAYLSRGESVMTNEETAKSNRVLRDVRAGKLDDRTYRKLIAGRRAAAGAIDNKQLLGALSGMRGTDVIKVGSDLYQIREKQGNYRETIRRKVLN